MRFGEFPLTECNGAILAHTLRLPDIVIKKGTQLSSIDLEAICVHGVLALTVAILDKSEVAEDEAARQIANSLVLNTIDISEVGTGRVNFHAASNGVFQVTSDLVIQINRIDPGITFATLANHEPVVAGRMVATIKIIPYGVSLHSIEAIKDLLGSEVILSVAPFQSKKIGVISTVLPGLKDKTIDKTISVLERRLAPSGAEIVAHTKCAHEASAIERTIKELEPRCELLIIFGASAISDPQDVIPLGLENAGGEVLRLGMPVDPGNLLMLGQLEGKPVIGAPGCARSPAENGFDFVLNRLLAGIEVTAQDIAEMGVGGLLMEIGSRPQPRQATSNENAKIAGIILAGGQSRRMGKANKLTQIIRGKAMIEYPVNACMASKIAKTIVVTGHEARQLNEMLDVFDIQIVHNSDFADGLSTSLKAGISALDSDVTHALIMLGDMPEISSEMIGSFIDLANETARDKIIMATHEGKRGNPVLWPRAHFDALMAISGDTGARHIIGQNMDDVVELELGEAASMDIDTPQALARHNK